MSATSDSTLADPEQLIADLQRQLAECRAERDEALLRETATAEVLQVINSSPGDLAPVFDAILEKALRLCGAAYGHVFRLEGDLGRAVAARGDSEFVEWLLKQGPVRPTPGGILHRMMQGERVIQIPDSTDTEDYRAGKAIRELIDRSGVRTTLGIALRNDSALLGAIFVNRPEVRPFSEKEVALLENFAAQAVIAMENARLITETREALEQQTATAEVLQVINSSPSNLAPVFDTMLEKAMRLCDAAFGGLFVLEGEQFRAVATCGLPGSLNDFVRQGFTADQSNPLLRGAMIDHIVDLSERPLDKPGLRAAVELGGARTMLNAALRKDDAMLGSFSIFRREARPFSDKQIALLQNFAAQAVIAMENARLLTETREALEQQTATAEVLQVINSSPGDVAPVFEAILEKALNLCEAALGSLARFDGEAFHWVATRGVPEAWFAEFTNATGYRPTPGLALYRFLHDGEDIEHVADIAADDSGRSAIPDRHRFAELTGARAAIWVALRKDEALLGALVIYRREVRPFSDKEIALLQNFAAQAVIAMENAGLLTETRESLARQTATAEVLQVINASPGHLAPVFDAMLDKATQLCDAEMGVLWTYHGDAMEASAIRGAAPQYDAFLRGGRRALSPTHQSLRHGEQVVQITDVAASENYRAGFEMARALVDLGGIHTILLVPLRKQAVAVGAFALYRRQSRAFSGKQIALLQNFAAQAVIAMENARLLDELRQRTDQVAELNRGLEARVAEQVEELGRVGRLKRFLAPQLAELIVSQGDEKILESHRREIVVVFCDLRGYTAFTETAEPEEVLDFLREYHGALGPLVSQFEGTLDQFSGDGIMVFFNDPMPIPDAAERAVRMAIAMREAAGTLIAHWRERGRDLGFGAGIAQGYATLGQIGFSERSGYTAIGTVCNVAARLCAEARDGQILLSQRVNVALKGSVATEQVGALALKGLTQPVVAYNVPLAAAQPTLRVINGDG